MPARNIYHDEQSDRALYMAVPQSIYEGLITERFGQLIVRRAELRLVVFDERQERIVKWIPSIDTEASSES